MSATHPPAACAVAFKEWAGVCDALAIGRQSLILRKGGIAEGPGGFAPEHPAFWLYPTHVHEAQQGLKAEAAPRRLEPTPGRVAIDALAVVELVGRIEQESALERLADAHVWTEETVRARFHYRRPGLWVLGVRVFRRPGPIVLDVTPEHAGCKTWVPLGEPLPAVGLVPALGDGEHRDRMERLRAALAS